MIFTLDGTPLPDALRAAAIRVRERRDHRRPVNYLVNDTGQRMFRTTRDKLGDIIRVYRVEHEHRPGAGYLERLRYKAWIDEPKTFPGPTEPTVLDELLAQPEPSLAEKIGGLLLAGWSQRKAAAELGISLGKLQRTLRAQPA